MGHTIPIVWDENLIHKHDAYGLADYRNFTIRLQTSSSQFPIPRTVIEEAYVHELVHWALKMLAEDEMASDEKLVHNLAAVLYQALKDG